MKYFRNQTTGEVFGYDETYENDLPLIAQAVANGWRDISDAWPPAPELDTEDMLKAKCKAVGIELLRNTDWVAVSDITTGSPSLSNQAEFLAYRQAVRALVIAPTTNPEFPDLPKALWV